MRELENVVNRASVIAQGDTILLKDLPTEIHDWAKANQVDLKSTPTAETDTAENEVSELVETAIKTLPGDLEGAYTALYQQLREKGEEDILSLIERAMIERALEETDGNQVKTSAILGITRATLRKRIEQFKGV